MILNQIVLMTWLQYELKREKHPDITLEPSPLQASLRDIRTLLLLRHSSEAQIHLPPRLGELAESPACRKRGWNIPREVHLPTPAKDGSLSSPLDAIRFQMHLLFYDTWNILPVVFSTPILFILGSDLFVLLFFCFLFFVFCFFVFCFCFVFFLVCLFSF